MDLLVDSLGVSMREELLTARRVNSSPNIFEPPRHEDGMFGTNHHHRKGMEHRWDDVRLGTQHGSSTNTTDWQRSR